MTPTSRSTCDDYADPAYYLDAFLAAYDPAVWGRATRPTGPLEDARVRSTRNQGARININVGSNTTIVGLGGSKVTGVNLVLNRVDNVIMRNLRFEDAYDCFPAWDPTDGALGNWNSLYDTGVGQHRHARLGGPQLVQRRQQHRRQSSRSTSDGRTRATTARSTSSGPRTWSRCRTTTSSTTTRPC